MSHELYLHRCLELAIKGLGLVAPNPMVGAVIVCDDKVIGEGYHQQFGEAHAEVNAVNNAIENGFGNLFPHSIIYVNLEPCSHHGKTPPCCDLLIKHNFKKVVISNVDPFPIVSGSGIKKIRDSGIEVEIGALEKEGRELNKRFFIFHEKKRPYIILKFAQSKDGYIAPLHLTSENRKISNDLSNKLVHQWRSEESAILVGTTTARIDNPSLTVRLFKGKNPVRLVVDKELALPSSNTIFNDEAFTLIFNSLRNEVKGTNEWLKIDFNTSILNQVTHILYERNLQSVLVEGGANLHQQFVNANLWDEIRVITAPFDLHNGTKACSFVGTLTEQFWLEGDVVRMYRRLTG